MNEKDPVKTNDLFRYVGRSTPTFEPGDTLWATHGADADDLSVTCAKLEGSTSEKALKSDLVPIPTVHVGDTCIYVGRDTADDSGDDTLTSGSIVTVADETLPGGREAVEVSRGGGSAYIFRVRRADLVLVPTPKRFVVYEAQCNTDLTEGKGGMRTVAIFSTAEEAVKLASNSREFGVMGIGGGDVIGTIVWASEEEYRKAPPELKRRSESKVWGHRKNPLTEQWDYGYLDGRDIPDPAKDPEVAKFLELREKLTNRYGGNLPA